MKIFISWSGERSRIIAEGLYNWLPKVIQAVKPFYSPEIEKGTRGIEEINKTLEGTSFGIICLTLDNLKSEWIHYEAGALSKIEGARIWTLLFNLKHSDVVQPLAQFQHTLAKRADIYKLLDSINTKLPEPLERSVLTDSFERWWSDFEGILQKAEKVTKENDTQDTENIRSDREILDEILELLRSQQRPRIVRGLDLTTNLIPQTAIFTQIDFVVPENEKFSNMEEIGITIRECFPISGGTSISKDYEIRIGFHPPVSLDDLVKYFECFQNKLNIETIDCRLTTFDKTSILRTFVWYC